MNRFLLKTFKQITFYTILNRYVSKLFLFNFLKVFLGFLLIIFLVNLIDNIDNVGAGGASFASVFLMAILRAPDFLNAIAPSMILFASLLTFFSLSSHSEVVIIRVAGFSMWHFVLPMAICSFFCGIFWILIYNNISISSFKHANKIESMQKQSSARSFIAPKSGIWIRQDNSEHQDGYIIIKSRMVYKDNIQMIDNSLWFFDNQGDYYKRVDNPSMTLQDGYWQAEDSILNKDQIYNKKIGATKIFSNLKKDIFSEKFLNFLEDPRLFSIYRLPTAIADLESLGLDSTKFKVQLNYLLTIPILFVAMVLLAAFFGINNFRDLTASIKITVGVAVGLFIYISLNFIKALGASKIIPIFLSTWMVVLMCLACSTILIYRKEDKN